MKVTEKHFQYFKLRCQAWAERIGLGDWQIYHRKLPLDGCFAEASCQSTDHIATISLNSRWDDSVRPLDEDELDRTAAHECLHIAIAEIGALARARYVSKEEIQEREEATVVRLQRAILGGSNGSW